MIIRSSFKCLTCDQSHIVRIGMGQEEAHTHHFQCQGCNEEMIVELKTDYKNISARVIPIENAEQVQETSGAPVINLDPNFVIPEEEQGKDLSFFRLRQHQRRLQDAEKRGSLFSPDTLSDTGLISRPYRRPDYAEEWRTLKKAWSLHRNGRDKLSKKRINKGSEEYYSNDPLNDIADWLWRFSFFLTQPEYHAKTQTITREIWEPLSRENLAPLMEYYSENLSSERATRYFETIKTFFTGYSEYAQVYFDVVRGLEVPSETKTTSVNFDHVKMFYGKAYENFTSLAEFLALLNNLMCNREFDEFESLTLQKYRRLDKSSRFGPFEDNPAFMTVCEEADNQIRNASHHEAFLINPDTQIITFRTGKGSTGAERSITYSKYLEKCTRIFLQIMALLQVELILCNKFNKSYPI